MKYLFDNCNTANHHLHRKVSRFPPNPECRNLLRSGIQLITLENPSNNSVDESALPQSEVGFLRVHQLLNSLDTRKLKALIQ